MPAATNTIATPAIATTLPPPVPTRIAGSTVAILRPAFLIDYRWRRALSLEVEVGYEGVREISGSDGSGRHGYYVYAGYRWDF